MNIDYSNVAEVESRLKELRLQKSRLDEESRLLETIKLDLLRRKECQNFAKIIDSTNSRIRSTLESVGFNGLIMPKIEIVNVLSSRNLEDPEISVDLKTFDNKVLTKFTNRSSLLEDWLEFIIKNIVTLQNLMIAYGENLIDSAHSYSYAMQFKVEDVEITVELDKELDGRMSDSFSISANKLMFRDYASKEQSLISISDHASVIASYDCLDLKFEYFVRPTSLDSIEQWIERIMEDYDAARETLIV